MMLTVYGRATSSNVQAVLWMLEELALGYTRLDYGEVFGGLDSPAFTALTPHGKIPVLTVGEVAIWETPAILRYLAGAYGDAVFWPRDPLARAEVDMWAEWAKHSVAEAFTGPVFWRSARTRPENRDAGLIRANLATLEGELAKTEPRLAQTDYLCGADLTLADIQFGHVLYRYFDIDIPRAPLPGLRAYYDRLSDRPAYRKTVMVSYESLRNTF
ncbi:glutathione S-transferase family protein [Aestuariivita sp.]|jgi:glutathione S-transferase|uniref:glutathione S-transferase family protein n=1 Tax=Aestuariivita sp. TaxID=1872407 RepID=UPI0025BDCB6F|nr:glutathione S-transferase family protein [Aestuariivita sp.]